MIKEYAIAIRLRGLCKEQAAIMNAKLAHELPQYENKPNVWHVSLFHAVYKTEELPTIWGQVQKLNYSNIKLHFSKTYTTEKWWVDWLVDKTPELEKLHNDVVDIASPYHQGRLGRCDGKFYAAMTDDKKAQVDEYGVSGVRNSYNPHATLFYQDASALSPLPEGVLEKAVKSLDPIVDMTCNVESIILGELGFNGNITKVLFDTHIGE